MSGTIAPRSTDRSTETAIRLGTPSSLTDPTDVRTRRTNEESLLRTRHHLTFRNAHAHIRISPSAKFREQR